MKLPDVEDQITDLGGREIETNPYTPFELAQLHCLRSIAVNLEVLAVIQAQIAQDVSPEQFQKILNTTFTHSVRALDESTS